MKRKPLIFNSNSFTMPERFRCPFCELAFRYVATYRDHIQHAHKWELKLQGGTYTHKWVDKPKRKPGASQRASYRVLGVF